MGSEDVRSGGVVGECNAQTVVRKTGDSKAFNMKVGLHHGSVLSPLLFVMVMKIITREL